MSVPMGSVRIASEEVRANYVKTVILLVVMFALLTGLSWLLGFLFGNIRMGLLIGMGISALVIALELLCAKFAVLHLTGCV